MLNKWWIRSKHRPSVQEAYLKLVYFEKTLKVISDLIQVFHFKYGFKHVNVHTHKILHQVV